MKIFKSIISFILVVVMVCAIIPAETFVINAKGVSDFYYRLSSPEQKGWYADYYTANCVKYAECRASEIIGYKVPRNRGDGGQGFWSMHKNGAIFDVAAYGSSNCVPKPGAIACWYGHVAIVEQVYGNTIVLSEGHSYTRVSGNSYSNQDFHGLSVGTWFTKTETTFDSKGKPGRNNGTQFLGYIYLVDNGSNGKALQDDWSINTTSLINTHYDSSASYVIGSYRCNSVVGVNIRNGAGTNYGKTGKLVAYNSNIYIYETKGNWGRCYYNNTEGWVCLDYFTLVSIPIPEKPVVAINNSNAALGDLITVSWGSTQNAIKYQLKIEYPNGNSEVVEIGNKTSYSVKMQNEGTYKFSVQSVNSEGKTKGYSSLVSCTAHGDSTVTFKDWDGTVLNTQTVKYGKNATAPESPSREGYSFQSWDGSYFNVTSDKTVTATYKINTYTVKFLDYNGNVLGDVQKVTYGSDAVEPENKNVPAGYKFVGWDTENYKKVYTDASDKTIMIHGIYEWENDDLPIVCSNITASRQSDGYYVNFDLKNYDKAITRGRAIVALKTESGKLVEMTESSAFSIPVSKTKSMEVFVPCDVVATKAEVIIVNSYSSGVPISENVETAIAGASDWTNWSENKPENADGALEIETKNQYRYRDKETSTANTKTKLGWTYTHRTESVGSWSGWSWDAISSFENESKKREVQTQSAIKSYNYQHYYLFYHFHQNGSKVVPYWTGDDKGHRLELTYDLTWRGTSSVKNDAGAYPAYYGYYSCDQGKTNVWYKPFWEASEYDRAISANYATQYRYKDTTYTYHFYRWKDWSDWSDDAVTATDNKEVETREMYRYKSSNIALEDDHGIERTITGKLNSNILSEISGKQVALFVYRYDGASDYTNEFVGQYLSDDVIDENGDYSFTFKLREEPTEKTGDYTVALGVEGTNNIFVIDTIEAPKPTYTVTFYDFNGEVIDTQTVVHGGDAVLPTNPEKEGYDFICWDKSNANIKEDTECYPVFKIQEITVVFVDWSNQLIEVETFEYGQPIVTPQLNDVDGYDFIGWDVLLEEGTVATQNMVITAQYEKKRYSVMFYDFDGNVISEQTVEYGESAYVPDVPEKEDTVFAGWSSDGYQEVVTDTYIFPVFYYEETTENPDISHNSGEYNEPIELVLKSEDDGAAIYYSINDGEWLMYSEPILIDKTCSVSYYAECLNKNVSETQTRYYCINTADEPSEWMTYDELPQSVKDNPSDYFIEQEDGYRFKDLQLVGSISNQSQLVASGWEATGETKTVYSEWQDEEISRNSDLIDFAVETQVVTDTTKTNYKYSHYKYVDDNGAEVYSPVEVDGFECVYEEIILETKINDIEFLDGGSTLAFNYNGKQWFSQTKVSGTKTQYRSVHTQVEYYKWTEWSIDKPSADDGREFENADVYRYANKNYHIVTIVDENAAVITYLVQDGYDLDYSKFAETEGHDFVGLFIDSTLTNKWNEKTQVKESCTLYSKYIPKSYTVVFQMPDGTEIDSQVVKYGESAIVPEPYLVKNYVFVYWDSNDYEFVTKDTVCTAVYVAESEYARVEIAGNETKPAYVGSMIKLEASVIPEALNGETLTWSSSNPSVADVDENGWVKCIASGTAVITVKVDSSGETDSCTIKVSTDNTVNLVLSPQTYFVVDSLNYIRGLKAATNTVEEVRSHFVNDEIAFFGSDGMQLQNEDKVGTGTVVKLLNGEQVLAEQIFIMTGDVNGDGWYDGADSVIVSCLANGMLTKDDVSEAVYIASDCNHDGVIDSFDVVLLERAGILLAKVDQTMKEEEIVTDAAYIEYLELIDQIPDVEVEDDNSSNEFTPSVPNKNPETTKPLNLIDLIIAMIKSFFEMLFASFA